MDKNGEVAHVSGLLDKVSTAHGRLEKAHVVREMFEFLADTTHLLHFKKFRDSVKDRIKVMSAESPDIVDMLRPSIDKLCAKLKSVDPHDSTIGCPGVLNPRNYAVLGMGGYGVVIKPALPNMVDGKLTEFPKNVTKVFFNEDGLEEALNKVSLLPNIMGNDSGHRSEPYTQTYRVRNMPTNLVDELKRKRPYASLNDSVHIMRMPNLGKDVKHIDAVYRQLRAVPVLTILEQIQKLLHQTASLASHGYGHFDIRETNVMINPETGVITIIDFDKLDTFNSLYHDYPFGFYSNPPEALLSMDDVFEQRNAQNFSDVTEFVDDYTLGKYIKSNMYSFKNAYAKHGIYDRDEYKEALMDALEKNIQYMLHDITINDHVKLLKQHSMPFFDNYGLGLTLLQLISYVYPFDDDDDDRELIKESLQSRITKNGAAYTDDEIEAFITALFSTMELLKNMSSMLMSKRPAPVDAANTMDSIVATYKRSTPAMSNNARAELNRMAVMVNGNVRHLLTEKTRKMRRRRRQSTRRQSTRRQSTRRR